MSIITVRSSLLARIFVPPQGNKSGLLTRGAQCAEKPVRSMGRIPCFDREASIRRQTGRTVVVVSHVADGLAALGREDWDDARALLELAATDDATPDVHDALAEARWWCGDVEGAIAAR